MKLKEILSISGYGGLFLFISQGRNGIIVEGLEDKKRMNAYAHYKVSALSDIAIFTDSAEIPLKDVFKKMFEKHAGSEAISAKASEKELKAYFSEIVPEYDRERVYTSDIRKVVLWYNLLHKLNLLELINEPDEEPVEEKKA
jgi:hypothetical protein